MPSRTPTRRGVAGIGFGLGLAVLCCLLFGSGLPMPATADAVIFRPDAHREKPPQVRRGVFLVHIKGVQTNRWNQNKSARWECDVDSRGSGWERVRFHTPVRRMRIMAMGPKRADTVVFAPMPVRGTVARQGKRVTDSSNLPEHCYADGGGGPAPPPPVPDCGTKRIKPGMRVSLFALNGKLTLGRTGSGRVPDLFRRCDWSGTAWPGLLTRNNKEEISTEFSPRWVFNPRFNRRTGAWSKVIMIARGARSGRSFGTWYRSTIRWTVTMKRLR